MKRRPCKRQVQAAKITVTFSAIILVVLWFGYFKFPEIFTQDDVNAIPEHAHDIVNFYIAESSKNDSAAPGDTNLQTGMNTNNNHVNTSDILHAEDLIRPMVDLANKSYNSNVSRTRTNGETNSPRNQDETSVGLEENTIGLTEEAFTVKSDTLPATTVDKSTASNNALNNSTEEESNENDNSENFTGARRPQNIDNNILISLTNSAGGLNLNETEIGTYSSVSASTQGVYKKDTEITSSKSSEHYDVSIRREHYAVETTSAFSQDTDEFKKFSNEQSYDNIETTHENTDNDTGTTNQMGIQNSTHNRTMTTLMNAALDDINTAATTLDTHSKALYTDVELLFDERAIEHTILLWNAVDWALLAHAEVDMGECRYTNCRLTMDKQKLNVASAVVLHIRDEGNIDEWEMLAQNDRNPNQVFVFQTLYHLTDVELPEYFDNLFNWSWSYRPSADIFQPYGALFKRNDIPRKSYHDIYINKKRSVVLISQDCDIPIQTQYTINKLKENIPVDILTPCNSTTLVRGIETLVGEYAFNLVLDSHHCDDFISEQFFRFSSLDVIMVVAGTGHYGTLPSGSFIDALDFPLLEDLGEYLAELEANEELYTTHLKRKDEYRVADKVFMYRNALCNMCDRLNNLELYQSVYSVEDMHASLPTCSDNVKLVEF